MRIDEPSEKPTTRFHVAMGPMRAGAPEIQIVLEGLKPVLRSVVQKMSSQPPGAKRRSWPLALPNAPRFGIEKTGIESRIVSEPGPITDKTSKPWQDTLDRSRPTNVSIDDMVNGARFRRNRTCGIDETNEGSTARSPPPIASPSRHFDDSIR